MSTSTVWAAQIPSVRNTFGRKGSEGTTGPVVCVSACACVHECVGGRGKHTDTGHEGEGECVSGCREGRSREEACPPALSLVRPCPNAVIISPLRKLWAGHYLLNFSSELTGVSFESQRRQRSDIWWPKRCQTLVSIHTWRGLFLILKVGSLFFFLFIYFFVIPSHLRDSGVSL